MALGASSETFVAEARWTFWELVELEDDESPVRPRRRALSDSVVAEWTSAAKESDSASETSTASGRSRSWQWDSEDSDDATTRETVLASDGDGCRGASQGPGQLGCVPAATLPAPASGRPAELGQSGRHASASVAGELSSAERTTLVLKGLPSACTREMLRGLLDLMGLGQCYDFMYLPVNFKTWRFFRYGVVNFATGSDALRALALLRGRVCWPGAEAAELHAEWYGKAQGLAAHVQQYRDSPVMHHTVPDDFKPILLQRGVRVTFPPPTAVILAPQGRGRRRH